MRFTYSTLSFLSFAPTAKPVGLKREPGWPKPGKLVKPHKKIIDVAPKPFRWVL